MNKCKGCQWYGKPYWSIINPCDNCPREDEDNNITKIIIERKPVFEVALTDEQIQRSILDKAELNSLIEQKDKEIDRLNNIIDELENNLKEIRAITFTKYHSNEWDNCLSFNEDILPLLKKLKELKEKE